MGSHAAPKPDVPALLRTAQDSGVEIEARHDAIQSLISFPSPGAQDRDLIGAGLLKIYAEPGPDELRGMVPLYFYANPDAHSALLTPLVEGSDPRLAVMALDALSRSVHPSAEMAEAFFGRLSAPDAAVARSAAQAIACIGQVIPVPVLAGKVAESDLKAARLAARLLAFQGGPAAKAAPALIAAASRGDVELTLLSYHALREAGPKTAPALVKALLGPDLRLRHAAVEFCATWSWWWQPVPSELFPALAERLGDPAEADWRLAADALAQYGKAALPQLKAALGHADPLVRRGACRALALQSEKKEDSAALAATVLNDRDPRVRREAALALKELGEKSSAWAEALRTLLKDVDPATRLAAVQALGEIKKKEAREAAPDLASGLADPDPAFREASALALGRAAKPDSLAKLLDKAGLSEDPSSVAAQMLAYGKAEEAPDAILDKATGLLDSDLKEPMLAALYCLARCAPDRLFRVSRHLPAETREARLWIYAAGRAPASAAVLTLLRQGCRHSDPEIRVAGCRGLSALEGELRPVALDFVDLLKDNDPCVAWEAARALSVLGKGASSAAADLVQAMADNRVCGMRPVGKAAAYTLEKIGPSCVPLLVEASRSSNISAQRRACRLLGNIGHKSPEVLSALIAALQSKGDRVATEAARGLRKLGYQESSACEALVALILRDGEAASGDISLGDAAMNALRVLKAPPRIVAPLLASKYELVFERGLALASLDPELGAGLSDELIATLKTRPARIQEVRSALFEAGHPAALKMAPYLSESGGMGKDVAVPVMARYPDTAALALKTLLESKDWKHLAMLVRRSTSAQEPGIPVLYANAAQMKESEFLESSEAIALRPR
ncbi:MAG: HEAT repeat domain-containing protein, partial [candidate division FCPU426 bacterium]